MPQTQQLLLTWRRLPDFPIVAVRAVGLPFDIFQRYAARAGFYDGHGDVPFCVGHEDDREPLLRFLEADGFTVEERTQCH